jgi:hypothetical protein
LVLGLGAPWVLAQTTTTTTQTQTQTQAPAPAASQTVVHHRHWEHSAQWQADHSANALNRQEVARIEGNTAYGSSR